MITNRYIIRKILNNNVVSARRGFNEVIVVGLAIGFNSKVGDVIDDAKIEKVFELQKNDHYKMMSLAQEIDEEIFKIIYNIIKINEEKFNIKIDNHAYLVLIDHINFTLDRLKLGYDIRNLVFEELRIMYAEELNMALSILHDVNKQFDVNLPEEEAGFLIMHIVNGRNPALNNQTILVTNTVLDCLNIIRDFYLISLKSKDISTQRIMIHIKLLIQRLISNTQVDFKEKILYNVFDDFPTSYQCALKLQSFLEEKFNVKVNEQELVYLTIHLNRLEMVYQYDFAK